VADLTLVLDAADDASVALLDGGTVLAVVRVVMRGVPEDRLTPAVQRLLSQAGGVSQLARVVCGAGPGSFTSLRVAGGLAKGLCAGADLPLYAVGSLALAVPLDAPGRSLMTLDALRGEVYAAGYAWDGRVLETLLPPTIIATEAVAAQAASLGAVARLARPDAAAAARLLPAVLAAGPVDRGRWEPTYGRLAEAQARGEAAHGRPLGTWTPSWTSRTGPSRILGPAARFARCWTRRRCDSTC
jgi:tRNA threonylcarbamoyladenosine biosynthesis protein TsaB